MKVVILAGGKGTRLAEETVMRPKPMVEIGGKPMLYHIMRIYAASGFREFLVACGYKSEMIKEYFHNFPIQNSDFFVNLATGERTVVNGCGIDWQVGVIDTGDDTMTGGRLLRLRKYIGDEPFMVTYGDGLGDIDVRALEAFHRAHGKIGTVTAVRPPSRFGSLVLQADAVSEFAEKPQIQEGWINGGFFVFNPEIFDYIDNDQMALEQEPLDRLARDQQLMAFRHTGFWQPMDTLREKLLLESLWASGNAPWKVWS